MQKTPTVWNPAENLRPEIVIGLVGAVGTNLDAVGKLIERSLATQIGYQSHHVRFSRLLEEYSFGPGGPPVKKRLEVDRIWNAMTAGTELRKAAGAGDALARLALVNIREKRGQQKVLRETAFILRSLKHAEEARFLQRLYGPAFLLVGAYSSRQARERFLLSQDSKKLSSASQRANLKKRISELIERDRSEEGIELGQQVEKTFHLADFFVNVDEPNAKEHIDRFIRLLFGYPHHTPNPDEHAMFIAHAAATRSGSLARQIGAVITTPEGDVVAVGANEVAQPGGGQAWEQDPSTMKKPARDRDYDRGHDTTSRMLKDLMENTWSRLWDRTRSRLEKVGGRQVTEVLAKLETQADFPGSMNELFRGTKVRDLIEFYREVHAEMGSLMDAAKRGVSVRGGTLYSTTFPCHECAKHIVAAGIKKVIYVAPYPKSKAAEFYPRVFGTADGSSQANGAEVTKAFVGVGPRRYRQLFSLTNDEGQEISRKNSDGSVAVWNGKKAPLRWQTFAVSYVDSEPWQITEVADMLDKEGFRVKKTK